MENRCIICGAMIPEGRMICPMCSPKEEPSTKMIEFDRGTALAVLKDISRLMYPTNDIFGTKTLVINRKDFEMVRRKYLDGEK